MIEHVTQKLTRQLEILTQCEISLERALDLLEATTQDLEEIIIINTMRESLAELVSGETGNLPGSLNSSFLGEPPKAATYYKLA